MKTAQEYFNEQDTTYIVELEGGKAFATKDGYLSRDGKTFYSENRKAQQLTVVNGKKLYLVEPIQAEAVRNDTRKVALDVGDLYKNQYLCKVKDDYFIVSNLTIIETIKKEIEE